MDESKSQIRFAESMFTALLNDVASGRPLTIRLALERDLKTVIDRLNHQGISFATRTLPLLSKAVVKGLETGVFERPSAFSSRRQSVLPKFLGELLREVFSDDGALLVEPCVASITEVLQICGLCYKLELPYTSEQEEAVVRAFLEAEADLFVKGVIPDDTILPVHPLRISWAADEKVRVTSVKDVLEYAGLLVEWMFQHPPVEFRKEPYGESRVYFDPRECSPRHGPGAVATGERGFDKWKFRRKYTGIHAVFPYYEYFVVGRKHLSDRLGWYRSLELRERGTAKVVLVPKDSRGPRLISEEPLEYQFIQQSLRQSMYNWIEKYSFARGHVNFTDQSINQRLAAASSVDGSFATLDMKEASDRVSCDLVEAVYAKVPQLLRCLMAVRSHETQLPNGTVVELKKYAPMGSAVCFPVEAVVFYALAVSAIACRTGVTLQKAAKSVYVYGDDLIVSTPYVDHVLEVLPVFGLKFNTDKCFYRGNFRESCGMDAYKGHNVAPLRWRKPWTKQRLAAEYLVSTTELASQFYLRGYYRVAELLYREVERRLQVTLPTVPHSVNVGYLTRKSRFPVFHTHHRVVQNRKNWQQPFHWAWTVRINKRKVHDPDGWAQMQQYALTGCAAALDFHPLSSINLKRGWSSILGYGLETQP